VRARRDRGGSGNGRSRHPRTCGDSGTCASWSPAERSGGGALVDEVALTCGSGTADLLSPRRRSRCLRRSRPPAWRARGRAGWHRGRSPGSCHGWMVDTEPRSCSVNGIYASRARTACDRCIRRITAARACSRTGGHHDIRRRGRFGKHWARSSLRPFLGVARRFVSSYGRHRRLRRGLLAVPRSPSRTWKMFPPSHAPSAARAAPTC
jgi:hypothetical protein